MQRVWARLLAVCSLQDRTNQPKTLTGSQRTDNFCVSLILAVEKKVVLLGSGVEGEHQLEARKAAKHSSATSDSHIATP